MDNEYIAKIFSEAQAHAKECRSACSRAKSFWHRRATFIQTSTACLALAVYSTSLFSPDSKQSLLELLLLWAFFVMLAATVVSLIYIGRRYERMKRYAEASALVHSAMEIIRDVHFLFQRACESSHNDSACKSSPKKSTGFEQHMPSNDIIIRLLRQIMDIFASTMILVTGVHCRTCVKSLNIDKNKVDDAKGKNAKEREEILRSAFYATTLIRDSSSHPTHGWAKHITNWVTNNSAFWHFFKGPLERCYFQNDLTKLRNYNNDSFKVYGNPPDFPWYLSLYARLWKRWPLPYRSTIVWPIRALRPTKHDPNPQLWMDRQNIIGFLCVDSYALHPFKYPYDFHLGACICDALYGMLKCWGRLADMKKRSEGDSNGHCANESKEPSNNAT